MKKWCLSLILLVLLTFNLQLSTCNRIYAAVSDTASYLSISQQNIPADGTSVCTVVVNVRSETGAVLESKGVTLSTVRGSSYDTVTGNPGITDLNGQCTFTILSSRTGYDTVTANCDGLTVSYLLFDDFSIDTSKWSTSSGTWTIEAGEYSQSDTTLTGVSYSGSTEWTDYILEVKMKTVDRDTTQPWYVGQIRFRDTGSTYYYLELNANGTLGLYRTGGVGLTSVSTGESPALWHSFKIIVSGINPVVFRIYMDGTLRISWSEYNYRFLKGRFALQTIRAHCHFDDVKVYPCKLNFTATKLKIISSSFNIGPDNPSPAIVVEAQDGSGSKATTFNDTINLSSSSSNGRYSTDHTKWNSSSDTTLWLSQGSGFFYYKDSTIGNPTITVSRIDLNLTSDTQTETIATPVVDETSSLIIINTSRIPADSATTCTTTAIIKDANGYPINGRSVTLSTSRGDSDVIVGNPGTTDSNGQCTFTITSSWGGQDTITASSDGKTITRGLDRLGAVGIWTFDTDALDISNYGNNGTPSSPVWTNGRFGCGLRYNGTSDYAQVPDADSLDLTTTWTWEAWVYPTAINTGYGEEWGTIYAKNGAFGSFWFALNSSNGITLYLNGGNFSWIYNSPVVTLNQWNHVVLTFDGKTLSLYSGGNPVASNSSFTTGTLNPNASPLRIGDADGGYHFKGMIDDATIYNRALSSDEIKARWNRACNFNFTATKLKINSSPFTTTQNIPSSAIMVEAWGTNGGKDTTFNETITLLSSSANGRFSLSPGTWVDTTIITLSAGTGTFFYKDADTGTPVITVSRAGLTSDSQSETITFASFSETESYLRINTTRIPADGTSVCTVTVTINSASGGSVINKSVQLVTSRGTSDTVSPSNPQTTDANGQCTFTIMSSYTGGVNLTAVCEGNSITENMIPNPSFEGGFINWTQNGSVLDSTNYYSGLNSSRVVATGVNISGAASNFIPVENSSAVKYLVSGWTKVLVTTAYHYFNINFYNSAGSWLTNTDIIQNNTDTNWVKYSKTVGGTGSGANFIMPSATTQVKIGHGWYNGSNNPSGTGWLDVVRIYRIPTINFTATRLKITSSPFTITTGTLSSALTVEAQDGSGTKDTSFNDTVVLATSSSDGRFSLSNTTWTDTSVVYLSAGAVVFYYKDNQTGNPVISVSRTGLTPDAQSETITASVFSETYSYLYPTVRSAKASGSESVTVTVTINNVSLGSISGKVVTLSTARSNSDALSTNPQVTDFNGQCTFTISSQYMGTDTISATCEGTTFNHLFAEDFSGYSEGANGSPRWSPSGGNWKVEAGEYSQDNTSTSFVSYAGNTEWTDYIFEARMKTVAQGDTSPWSIGKLYFRYTDSSNLYWLELQTNGWLYIVRPGGNVMTGQNTGEDPMQWHTYKVVVTGSNPVNFKVYLDDVYRFSWSESNYRFTKGKIGLGTGSSHTHFDNVRVYPCWVNFSATRLKITSSPFSATQNAASSAITIEAQDNSGVKDSSFNETVFLQSSSESGVFSLNSSTWANTTAITLGNGSATFYYKDGKPGNPTITVSRAGLTSDSQSETIVVPVFGRTHSFLSQPNPASAKANNTDTSAVVANIRDVSGGPVVGISVTLSTARGNSTTITPNPGVSDNNGQCTFALSSGYFGTDTLTATCAGETFNYLFFDDFSQWTEGSSGAPIWSASGGNWRVTGGEYTQDNMTGTFYAYAGDKNWTDYTIELRIKTVTPGASVWLIGKLYFRYTDGSNCYWVEMQTNGYMAIYRPGGYNICNGIYTGLSPTDWHTYKVVVSGSDPVNFKVYLDGALKITHSESTYKFSRGQIALNTSNASAIFDDVKVYPSAVNFSAGKVGFLSSAFKVKGGSASPPISIYAGGTLGGLDTSYNGIATISTSSNSGSFSLSSESWNPVNTVTLTNGQGTVYYKDLKSGNPTIFVVPSTPELIPDAQTETISAAYLGFTSSPFTTSSSDSTYISVRAYQVSGETDTTFNDWVVLSSPSSKGKFSISNTPWQDTTVLKFNSGNSGFYYKDKRGGNPVLTVAQSEIDLSASQSGTITMPVLSFAKDMQNLRSGVSGTYFATGPGDTIEYTITIGNSGYETAANVIITDTDVFDTSIYSILVFVSMDTSTVADSWTYATTSGWQPWGSYPTVGAEDIKGLRWRINALGPISQKTVKFRVRVK